MYWLTLGPIEAFRHTVLKPSYSRYWGSTSWSDGQIGVGKLFLDNGLGTLLVARVQKRKQKTDGDRLDPLGLHHPHRLTHLVLIERAEHLAVRGNDPLADRTPIASPHQGVLLPRHVLVQA